VIGTMHRRLEPRVNLPSKPEWIRLPKLLDNWDQPVRPPGYENVTHPFDVCFAAEFHDSRQVSKKDSRLANSTGSAPSRYLIHYPASARVLARLAAVVQDVCTVAAGILEGIGQDGHGGEIARVVHLLREGSDS
jgi:hypothetical protein